MHLIQLNPESTRALSQIFPYNLPILHILNLSFVVTVELLTDVRYAVKVRVREQAAKFNFWIGFLTLGHVEE
jgi:hypothetical protein